MTIGSLQRTGRRLPHLALLLGLGAGCSTATLKPPKMQVERLEFDKVRITGMGLKVGLHLRNPNTESLNIERFKYKLKINGFSLGEGYHVESTKIDGFGEARLESDFEINWLTLPGSVKSALDRDTVEAEVHGTFYIKSGLSTRELRFSDQATVPISRGSSGQ